ncbi:15863_t:CDS:2, partial [Acaulospora colombiana]
HPLWKDTTVELKGADGEPPISNYRDGVFVENKFYITILEDAPVCWILDFTQKLRWQKVPVLIDMDPNQFHPVKSTFGAAIKREIYLFGGENRLTDLPTNSMYRLNICNMKLSKIPENETFPTPRSMHSLNPLGLHHLILFGGRCVTESGDSYDTKDFYIYDVYKNAWTSHASTPNLPYPRSSHASTTLCGKLFIYGGQQISSHSPSSSIHDDEDVWEYDFLKCGWRRYLTPMSPPFFLPEEWISTNMTTTEDPLEQMMILYPARKMWVRAKVQGMPRLECMAIKVDPR